MNDKKLSQQSDIPTKVIKGVLSSLRQFLATGSPLKMMKMLNILP